MNLKTESWWQLLAIQTGGALCLPVIIIGSLLAEKYGWVNALITILLGNVLLLFLGLLFARLSTSRPQSTVEHAIDCFGENGRFLFSSIMIVSMLAWFGIQLNVMSQSLSFSSLPCHIGMGGLIVLTLLFGMKAIKNLSYISAPLLLVSLLYALFSMENLDIAIFQVPLSFGVGLGLVIGANIAAIIDLPTFFRHARSPRDGKICIILLYSLVVPSLEFFGAYLFSFKGINLLSLDGVPIWMAIFLSFSIWQTNNCNLYSAIISSESLVKKGKRVSRVLLLGLMGIGIACLNPLAHLEGLLNGLSLTMGSMGAVIIGSAYNRTSSPKVSFTSWTFGVLYGLFTSYFEGLSSGMSIVDAFCASLIIQTLLTRKKTYETINN